MDAGWRWADDPLFSPGAAALSAVLCTVLSAALSAVLCTVHCHYQLALSTISGPSVVATPDQLFIIALLKTMTNTTTKTRTKTTTETKTK